MRACVCAILALLGFAVGCKTGSSNHFAIYLTAERVAEPERLNVSYPGFAAFRNEGVTSTNDWTNVALIAPPVISANDIIAMDCSNQLMEVRRAAMQKLPDPSSEGRQFILVVNGQRIFLGNFWTWLSSDSTTTPTLIVVPEWNRLYLRGTRAKGDPDPWSDPRIVQSLKKLHKLGPVEWPAVVEHVGSTNSPSH